MYLCMHNSQHFQQSISYQPGMVANPARGQLNREKHVSLSPFAPENSVSRDGFGRHVPRQAAHSLHSHSHRQTNSGAFRYGVHHT